MRIMYPRWSVIIRGQNLIGHKAIDFSVQAPEDTIFSIKRLIGRGYNDKVVQEIIKEKGVKYKIKPPANGSDADLSVALGGKDYTAVDISAMILNKVKENAESKLNDKVEYAVITVTCLF